MQRRTLIAVALLSIVGAHDGRAALAEGNAARGLKLYESRCGACHSVEANRVGPRHKGVFGRAAGSLADYLYSKALKSSDFVWNDSTLDRWLTDPQAFVPGQKMNFKVNYPNDRADLIAYLRSVSD